jgi:hypothetical protein
MATFLRSASDIVPVLLCAQNVTSGIFPGILVVLAPAEGLWEHKIWQLSEAINFKWDGQRHTPSR